MLLEDSSFAQDQVASSWNIFHIQSLTLGRDMEAVSCSFPTSFISLGEVSGAGMAIRPLNSTTYSCRVSVLPEPSVGVILHLVAPGSEVLNWQGLHESSHGQMRMPVFNCEVSVGTPLSEKLIPVTIFHALGPAKAPTP